MQFGMMRTDRRMNTPFSEHWFEELNVGHAELTNAVIGDLGSQAVWDAMLQAFRIWVQRLAITSVKLQCAAMHWVYSGTLRRCGHAMAN